MYIYTVGKRLSIFCVTLFPGLNRLMYIFQSSLCKNHLNRSLPTPMTSEEPEKYPFCENETKQNVSFHVPGLYSYCSVDNFSSK